MKIKVPRQVQIGSHTYSIVKSQKELGDGNFYGEVNHRLQLIRINSERPPSQCAEALLHELLHIVDTILLRDKLDENRISLLSEGLSQAIYKGLNIELDWGDIPEEK